MNVMVDGIDRHAVDRSRLDQRRNEVVAALGRVELNLIFHFVQEGQAAPEGHVALEGLHADAASHLAAAGQLDVESTEVGAYVQVGERAAHQLRKALQQERDAPVFDGPLPRHDQPVHRDGLVDAIVLAVVQGVQERAGTVKIALFQEIRKIADHGCAPDLAQARKAGLARQGSGDRRHIAHIPEAIFSDRIEGFLERQILLQAAAFLEVAEHRLVAAEEDIALVNVGMHQPHGMELASKAREIFPGLQDRFRRSRLQPSGRGGEFF